MTRIRDFALEVHFSKWEFTVEHNMAASDAESIGLDELLARASPMEREQFASCHLGYTETFGAPELRTAISSTYDTTDADDILCFAGAEEALFIVNHVLLEPSDHAIVVTPNYQSCETIPLSICSVTGIPLDADNDWALDLELLRGALRGNTKLISINLPHNPTGTIFSQQTMDELIRICQANGVWLLCDEVYRLIERDPSIRVPQVVDVYDKGISLNVMSKAYGLPGLRIGWVACKDRDMLVRFERYKHYLSICCSAPSEKLATIALHHSEWILERNRRIVAANVEAYEAFFAEYPDLFQWQRPDGGCVAFVRYKGKEGVEEFCRRTVEEAGVLFLPASIFRSELTEVPKDYFRVGLGRKHVPDGLRALKQWLSTKQP